MKISRYTFILDSNERYYLYNSLSNALVEVDHETYSFLKEHEAGGMPVDESSIDKTLWQMLTEKRFLCETQEDELLFYKASVQSLREQRDFMHLTVVPTMDCCFRCFYCFEHTKNRKYMSEEVMDSIVQYVKSLPELKRMLLTWFGGEPLMAQPLISQFFRKLRASFDGDIQSDIITTGYHIDRNTVDLFRETGISSVQITLDGCKESHNKIKYTDGCSDVYSKTIENSKMLADALPDINIVFRVNITKENAGEYPEVFKTLFSIFEGKRISVCPAIVKNSVPPCDGNKDKGSDSIYFTNTEFTDYIIDLLYKFGIHTPFIRYPGNQLCECAIRDKMAMAFDPEGYAYKCWEKIGDTRYAIGKLDGKGNLSELNITELNRELYGADPLSSPVCTRCKYLPICNGGCPIDRIQNEFEGYTNELCAYYKGRIKEFMEAHIKLREAGYNNR